ncbi:MAG: M18 family aminopeptidase, partial [Clostridiales bacterium]|nr:M18 family aminopeptidase [Clostridiales bacterium]
KTVFDNAGVQHQPFFNRSDMRSGSTLGGASLRHVSIMGADIGLAQLAMHSACESCALEDYETMVNGITAFYGATFRKTEDGITVD